MHLALQHVHIGRERFAFTEYFEVRLRGVVKRHHHEVKVYCQRVHYHDLTNTKDNPVSNVKLDTRLIQTAFEFRVLRYENEFVCGPNPQALLRHTSPGSAPTSRADESRTLSSIETQGSGSSKCPSTPCSAHLSSSELTTARVAAGMAPRLFPQRYTASAPFLSFGMQNSDRN